ncbi:MAG TPA: hypothetical protein VGK37_06405 [Casimicrobiaceae bacterium]|jgi:hypothetical protein
MRLWFALLVAPLLALTDQAVAFALVHWACERQSVAVLHVSHALFLVIATAAAASAWRRWRETADVSMESGEAALRVHFLAGVAAMVASLSALAIAAMWIPTWMISPCIA